MTPNQFDMVTGTIKDIMPNGEKMSLLIVDDEGMEYIFHINEYTIVITFQGLKVGQRVNIIFNGILTRSLPPQGNAIIVNGLIL